MPLYEDPVQKCGTRHWLTERCPKGICDLLVFEKDMVKLVPLEGRDGEQVSKLALASEGSADVGEGPVASGSVREGAVSDASSKAGLETLAEEATKRSALSAAEKQKRYRERQKAKRKGG